MNLKNYIPINNKESVDQILSDLLNRKLQFDDINKIEFQILVEIKKFKIQLYFKEQLKSLKSQLKFSNIGNAEKKQQEIPQKKKKDKNTKLVGKIRYQLTYEMLENKNFDFVAEIVGQKTKIILSLISKRNPSLINLDGQNTFNEIFWNLSFDFLINSYDLKMKKEAKQPTGGLKSLKKFNSKFKPSYGHQGNYSKLIYIGTKS